MDGLAAAKARFGDSISYESGKRARAILEEYRRTGVMPDLGPSKAMRMPTHTNEERLAYYRAHGLDKCDDYPGGDAAFATDVLSGAQHDNGPSLGPLKAEDAYVIGKMADGTFAYDGSFEEYGFRPEVRLAYIKYAGKHGFVVHVNYPYGSLEQYEKDVLSGAYARRLLGVDKG